MVENGSLYGFIIQSGDQLLQFILKYQEVYFLPSLKYWHGRQHAYDQTCCTQNTALMGLLIFQGYVSLNTGLFHSSYFCGGLDLVQKCHGMHTKANFFYSEREQKGTCTLTQDSIILAQKTELYQLDERFPQVWNNYK